MGFERGQPSQDFGPTIGDGKVMTIIHVEPIGGVRKRGSITSLGAGSRRKIAIIILREGGIDKSIISWGIGVMEGLGDEARMRRPFSVTALGDIVEDRLMRCGGVR